MLHVYPLSYDPDRAVFVSDDDLALIGGDVSDAVAVAAFVELPLEDKVALAALTEDERAELAELVAVEVPEASVDEAPVDEPAVELTEEEVALLAELSEEDVAALAALSDEDRAALLELAAEVAADGQAEPTGGDAPAEPTEPTADAPAEPTEGDAPAEPAPAEPATPVEPTVEANTAPASTTSRRTKK